MLSYRVITKIAGMEMSQSGIGVSTGARMFMRNSDPRATGLHNPELNEMIATDFSKGTPVHRFKLTKGERKGIAEIRQSGSYYYVAFVRGRGTTDAGYDILVIQQSYKESNQGLTKSRLAPGWGVE